MTDTLGIERRHIYRAKKPKRVDLLFGGEFYDDRQVVYVSATQVQYDSPTVRWGRKYPTIDRAKFEAWAGEDVTEGYPPGDWAQWKAK